MWTDFTRVNYMRKELRYATDLTNEEWGLIYPLVYEEQVRGRPRKVSLREVVNALFYMVSSGCAWRMLPKDFPRMTTIQHYFYKWRGDGTLKKINHCLLMQARLQNGREASPTAGVIDSQSVKTTAEARSDVGYDGGKKIKGRKRHIITDTTGLLVGAVVHRADIQDRDGASMVLGTIRKSFPWLRYVFADGGYAGKKLKTNLKKMGKWTFEIVKRSDYAKGFEVLPRRWVVERTLAWLSKNRRLAKDFEASVASSLAWLFIASIKMLTRRIANLQRGNDL